MGDLISPDPEVRARAIAATTGDHTYDASRAPRWDDADPGPGTRVWALFDDDSLCQSWRGGTIISISGIGEELRYDVVFDDG